jgi:hypothetical protein
MSTDTLFGRPIRYERPLLECGSAEAALTAYRAGYTPLVHPSLYDYTWQAINAYRKRDMTLAPPSLQVSVTEAFMEDSNPLLAEKAVAILDEQSTAGLTALISCDGAIRFLDCRTSQQKRDDFARRKLPVVCPDIEPSE